MLPNRDCQLLTAYVDGELSKRQLPAVQQLLQSSAEARALLRQFEDNRESLKNLPRQKLDADFAGQVLKRIDELQPAFASQVLGRSRGIPTWVGASVAAAVLLVVTTVSYLFFASISQSPEGPVARQKPEAPSMPARIIRETFRQFGKSIPPGIRMAVKDLNQEKEQAKFLTEFKKEKGVHLELECQNSAGALDSLEHAFKNNGIKLLVDSLAKAKLKEGDPTTEVVVYAEDLRPDELAQILRQFGVAETKQPGDHQFETFLLNPMSSEHRQQVSNLLGVDAKQLQPPIDLPTFIEAPTTNVKQKGRPNVTPAGQRLALVMASIPGQNPSTSAQIQQFLQSRQRARPGTLQVVLVVRPAV